MRPIDFISERDYHRTMSTIYQRFTNALKYDIMRSRFYKNLPYEWQVELSDRFYDALCEYSYHKSSLDHMLSHNK